MWNVYVQAGGQSMKNEKIRYRDLYSASIPYPIEGTIHEFFRFEATLETQANRFDQNEKEGTFINLYLLTFEKKVDANLRKFVIEEWIAVSSSWEV